MTRQCEVHESPETTRFLFYCSEHGGEAVSDRSIDDHYLRMLWRPTLTKLVPRGVSGAVYRLWWLLHVAHLFGNRDYCLFLVYDGRRLIHRSCVVPRWFRFPFMKRDDLHIAATWTAVEYRGRGIAPFAVQEIQRRLSQSGRRFWYMVGEDNKASIRAIEKAGFSRKGTGRRVSRYGFSALGAFVLDEPPRSSPS